MLHPKSTLLASLLLTTHVGSAVANQTQPLEIASLSSPAIHNIAPLQIQNKLAVLPGKNSLKVKVMAPAPGSIFFASTPLMVKWHVEYTPSKDAKIDIILEQIGVQNSYTIATGIRAIKEQISWKINIPQITRKGTDKRFRLKIIDSQTKKVLSTGGIFNIRPKTDLKFVFTEPKAKLKIYWCKGNSYPIRWESSNYPAGPYNIDLIEERSDQIRVPVAQGVGANGSITFNANHTNQGAAVLRMTLHNNKMKLIFPSLITYSNHKFNLGQIYDTRRGNPMPISLSQVCMTQNSLSVQLLDANHQVLETIASNIPPAADLTRTDFTFRNTNRAPGTYYIRATDGSNHFDRQFTIQ